MAKDHNQLRPPSREARESGYETSGISVRGLAIFLVALIVCAAIIHAGVWYLYGGYLALDREKDRTQSALTDPAFVRAYNKDHSTAFDPRRQPLPPAPRLQPSDGLSVQHTPEADLHEMYQGEDKVFKEMGWVIDEQTHQPTSIPESAVLSVIDNANKHKGATSQPAKREGTQ
ncbi:MAG TPA: hypothetical protein VLJ39_03615 [Tepidisphaeraceae bacterium]|nr:hypothetical protein [Tepidisphaeraceae bacterium]